MKPFFQRLQERLGPVWGPAALLFVASRITDVVNAFIGIWLVPHYVPMKELGAVLPLTQVATFVALPLSILLSPYIKLLNVHGERGEYGKAKSLIRDASILAAVVFALTLVATPIFFENIFRKFQIENGRLALAIVLSAVLGALAPVFTETLRALKRFGVTAATTAFFGPVRLVLMLLLLPFRGLTGYFVAQSGTSLYSSAIALVDFFRRHAKARCEPYWKEDRKVFLTFCVPLTILSILGQFRCLQEMLLMPLIPTAESAAYYQLTRFTEIASYLGGTLVFILFPLASAAHEKGRGSAKLLTQTTLWTFVAGTAVSALLALFGHALFEAIGFLRPYAPYTKYFFALGMFATLRVSGSCVITHETACARFSYGWYAGPISAAEIVLIRVLLSPKYGPSTPWTLDRVIAIMLGVQIVVFLCNITQLFFIRRRERRNA